MFVMPRAPQKRAPRRVQFTDPSELMEEEEEEEEEEGRDGGGSA